MKFEEWWAQYLAEGGKTHFNICANEESARSAWDAAREACAKVCDEKAKAEIIGAHDNYGGEYTDAGMLYAECADDIRDAL